ncbi:MAG: hypothetical protein SF187_04195 [Deltaproteobacteria bacterium]|nr:hypothetical protein [Deltaproteobacteria bacterium]
MLPQRLSRLFPLCWAAWVCVPACAYHTTAGAEDMSAGQIRAASAPVALVPATGLSSRPLDSMTIVAASGGTVVVTDGDGHEYFRAAAQPRLTFNVGGALGTHHVTLKNAQGKPEGVMAFDVDAATTVVDNTGKYTRLFNACVKTMTGSGARLEGREHKWRNKSYNSFVSWVLDQSNTMKGMLLFSTHAKDMVDLYRENQQQDGMIWSFVEPDNGPGYYDTAYGHLGYAKRDGGLLFVRQPNENHVEYEYVNMLYQAWKATGDDAWMSSTLDSGLRALQYSVTSPVRYSKRFQLLKRPLTIDSWDFQVEDEYLIKDTTTPTMTINPERTKFGVFFGDNTGYVQASARLAEMLDRVGRRSESQAVRQRGSEILDRLTKLSWNGRFFRHFVDEDSSVHRDLGVNMDEQVAQANAYSLNRGISHEQAVAIIKTYRDLRARLPHGSPGEWYAIYPPFEKGFGSHNDRWQYMNGGVAGHAAGELARGALAHGFESYGADVMDRSLALAERTDGLIHFAYTGAYEELAKPSKLTPVSLIKVANMSFGSKGGQGALPWADGEKDNDLATLPPGRMVVQDVPFDVIDAAQNKQRGAVAVARRRGFAAAAQIPVKQKAGAVYLLHTIHKGKGTTSARNNSTDDVAGAVIFKYNDGTQQGVYVRRGEHVTGWWFPTLKKTHAGVAWTGANPKSSAVGLSWAGIANPQPDKEIHSIELESSVSGAIYIVAALTLADRLPETKAPPVSYGGPDNWAAANMSAALTEGLAGVVDADRALQMAELSPRWSAAGVNDAQITIRYPSSKGYVAYHWQHAPNEKVVNMQITGNARQFNCRVLVPAGARPTVAKLDGVATKLREQMVENSRYAVVNVPAGVHHVAVSYAAVK